MDDKELEQQEKRDRRRRRRIRNQMISYGAVLLVFLLVLGGFGFAFSKVSAARQEQQEVVESKQDVIENILASEEEILIPESETLEESLVVEMTPEEKLDEIVNAGIQVMPLEDKVAGLFIVTPESITGASTAVKAGQGTQRALATYAVGGIVYTGKNIQSQAQFTEMLKNTNLYTKYPLFLAMEDEGGEGSALVKKGIGEKTDSAAALGQTQDVTKAYEAGEKIGSSFAGVGLNLNLAPVADVNCAEGGYLGDRAFGTEGQTVGDFAVSFSQGLRSKGVTSCLKHFPGNGASSKDPNRGISDTEQTEEQFRNKDFQPFLSAIAEGTDMIMISTITAKELTGNTDPCVFSEKVVTDILRNEMGFKGVIITDALNMKAISDYYDSEEAAIMALKAGCDMILMPEDFEKAYQGVLEAVQNGTISEERVDDALRRIYRIKYAGKVEQE